MADAAAQDLDADLARFGRRDLNRLFDEIGTLGPHDHGLAKWRGSERGQYMMTTKTREGEQRSSENFAYFMPYLARDNTGFSRHCSLRA